MAHCSGRADGCCRFDVAQSELTFIVPGLFSAPGAEAGLVSKPHTPQLDWLVAHGEISANDSTSIETELLRHFHVLPTPARVPVAAVSRAFDTGEFEPGVWMRADPIHLQLGRFGLMLSDPSAISLSAADAEKMVSELAPLFRERSMRLDAPHPQRWYVQDAPVPVSPTIAPHDALGQVVDPSPDDEDTWWRELITEVQMTLHQSPVNLRLEERGILPVNSLWFWGEGSYNEQPATTFREVWGDDAFELGLGKLTGANSEWRPTDGGSWLSRISWGGPLLLVCRTGARRTVAWPEFVTAFDKQWMQPVVNQLKERRFSTLTIIDPGGTCLRSSRRRRWRRTQTVWELINNTKNIT